MKISLQNINNKIHFIGIGGIGMSGIAEVLKALGYNVSGSDINDNSNDGTKEILSKIQDPRVKILYRERNY